MVYYNEYDKFAANWIRALIKEGLIPYGDVDERDIKEINQSELKGYTSQHYFAGIGGWAYALRLAGWPDDKPVWTGSCPCQSFSTAGSRKGFDDERHLWPYFYELIKEQQPEFVFGEQVASKSARDWLDLVQTDLENVGYGTGANDLCSAGVGAPHIRQRIYWVAYRPSFRFDERWNGSVVADKDRAHELGDDGNISRGVEGLGTASGLADSDCYRPQSFVGNKPKMGALYDNDGCSKNHSLGSRGAKEVKEEGTEVVPYTDREPLSGFWKEADWIFCRDGRFRPVEPGTFPMDYGLPERVGRLCGYGNAINPYLSAEFVKAFMSLL